MEQRGSIVTRLAFLPAALVGRFRAELRVATAQDERRFIGGGIPALIALAAIAVGYPVLASVAHSVGDPTPGGDSLLLALRPAFDVVYSESIPFMVAAVGVGLFSPAMGVLFMTVFMPADLVAASGSVELENYSFQFLPFGAFLARFASYGLLWILAVEIPLQARNSALRWGSRGSPLSRFRLAVGTGSSAAVLTFLWAAALPLLIMPVYTWSGLQVVARWATDPTWYHWPFLVGGAGIAGCIAALIPRPLEDARVPVAAAATSLGRRALIARQTLLSGVFALLLGGLITTPAEGLVVVGGMFLVGPIFTMLLPKAPVGPLERIDARPRGTLAMTVVLGVAAGILVPFGPAMFAEGYLPFAVLVVCSIGAFRVLAEGGAAPSQPSAPSIAR